MEKEGGGGGGEDGDMVGMMMIVTMVIEKTDWNMEKKRKKSKMKIRSNGMDYCS